MRVGLAVMRLQPLHKGHCRFVLNPMIEMCETAIVGLGSAQESGTRENPFTVEQRIQMIRNVYGERIKIVPLHDLNSVKGTNEWVEYVVSRLTKLGLPEPTDYFSGSLADAAWYYSWFDKRNDKYVHIADRATNEYFSGSEIRALLSFQRYAWLSHVPGVNVNLIEQGFPPDLMILAE